MRGGVEVVASDEVAHALRGRLKGHGRRYVRVAERKSHRLTEPVTLEAGDIINWECAWNNSRSNPDRVLDEPEETV